MDPGLALGGDREQLSLHPRDEALIEAVVAANPRTIVAIMAGSAVITEAWRHRVPALLMLWYPGMEGGHALADVLTGATNPSGRLPCTFPARAEDLPFFDRNATKITYDLWHGYRKLERDGATPAFPFGFGLSYTTFDYAGLKLARTELDASGTLEATVEVTNAGAVAGGSRAALCGDRRFEGGACAEGAEGVCPRGARPGRDAHRAVICFGGRPRLLRCRRLRLDCGADHIHRDRGRDALDPNALRAAFRVA